MNEKLVVDDENDEFKVASEADREDLHGFRTGGENEKSDDDPTNDETGAREDSFSMPEKVLHMDVAGSSKLVSDSASGDSDEQTTVAVDGEGVDDNRGVVGEGIETTGDASSTKFTFSFFVD